MLDHTAAFEAMLAGVTAPPLSLDEFRVFVDQDPSAKSALAFCEWYQRYREVYFDCATIPSTRYTATSNTRSAIPSEFVASRNVWRLKQKHSYTDHVSVRSLSVPNFRAARPSSMAIRKMYTLKSHSFSILSDSIPGSAFNTTGTSNSSSSNSSGSRGNADFDNTDLKADAADIIGRAAIAKDTTRYNGQAFGLDITGARTAMYATIPRRHTVPAVDQESAVEDMMQSQESSRAQLQSLLVYECWARFLSFGAPERVNIPELELMYVKERLPLDITQMPRPLLCCEDMLETLPLAANPSLADRSILNLDNRPERPVLDAIANNAIANLHLPVHQPLQHRPSELLKRSIMTQIHTKRLNVSHVQSPLSHSFGITDIVDSDSDKEAGAGKIDAGSYADSPRLLIAGLRRVSTMPSLKPGSVVANETAMPALNQGTGLNNALLSTSRHIQPVSRTKRLIPTDAIRNVHRSLRPYPPLGVLSAESNTNYLRQSYGYKPIPTHIPLLARNHCPPALFETIAKISANHLLQIHFPDFHRQAHYNVTLREQRNMLAGSVALFVLGLAITAALVVLKLAIAWRAFAIPMLLLATLFLMTSYTRVSIYLWWARRRASSLVFREAKGRYPVNSQAHIQAYTHTGQDICAIQAVTGTLQPPPSAGFAGSLYSTGNCAFNHRCRFCRPPSAASIGKLAPETSSVPCLGAASSLSLWSHLTISPAVGDIFDCIVCFMMRNRGIGDQWHIDFRSYYHEVYERYVLRGQCFVVAYQLVIILVLWTALLTTLFLIP